MTGSATFEEFSDEVPSTALAVCPSETMCQAELASKGCS